VINNNQGVICSGMAYYVQGVVTRERGPVFVTSFSPLCMIITAALGSLVLAEQVHLGRFVLSHKKNSIKHLITNVLIKVVVCVQFGWFQHIRGYSDRVRTLHCGVGQKQRP